MIRSIHKKILPVVVATAFFIQCNDAGQNSSAVSADSTAVAKIEMVEGAVPNALPFTLAFEQQQYNDSLPAIQSYVSAVSKTGPLLIIGGRSQGLHTFLPAPDTNFIPKKSNNIMYVIDPLNGKVNGFNVDSLPATMAAPLQSTNQQLYHDPVTDLVYVVGGYGWNVDKTDMLTFNTIISFKLEAMVSAIQQRLPAKSIAALMEVAQDDIFAVTGGELFKMNSVFYLVFGQKFTGQYRAFGGTDFTQEYTEQVRIFTLVPNTLKILTKSSTSSSNPDRPFHRRDGNTVASVDPATGKQRIAAFGGVFRPGIIGAYTYPVYINNTSAPTIDTTGNQKFSQYECPVISIHDSTGQAVYHTFFGGIGHYYYSQTPSQNAAYKTVTAEGRNDGFPFVADITTFMQSADGGYQEYILPFSTPSNRLVGSTARFLETRQLADRSMAYSNGVIKLPAISSANRQLIGYIFGGIEAQNPLPLKPNSGTFVTNSIFAVYLTRKPSAAIPASEAKESTKSDANLKRE